LRWRGHSSIGGDVSKLVDLALPCQGVKRKIPWCMGKEEISERVVFPRVTLL
jgi:hypothetical protein